MQCTVLQSLSMFISASLLCMYCADCTGCC